MRSSSKTPEGVKTIENDFVLAMTGYKPNFELLESLGVQFLQDEYRTPMYDPSTNAIDGKGSLL